MRISGGKRIMGARRLNAGSLRDNIAATYEDVDKRDDVEVFDSLDDDQVKS